MEEQELSLLLKYPLISKSSNKDGETVYNGSVHVSNEDYKVCITESDNRYKLTLPGNLARFSEEFDAVINKLHTKTIITVLDNLAAFIDSKVPTQPLVDRTETYRHILHEYTDFTKFYLNVKSCRLAPDLSKISISTLDQSGREHWIEICNNFDDREVFSIASFDLPHDKFKKSASLKDVYDQFIAAIEAFQLFFDVMDTLDRDSWVLDPERPKRSCTYRRIWIEDNLSIIVTLDATNVFKLPQITFLGPERLVEKYRSTLNSNIVNWEPENGIVAEILKLLALDCFPRKPTLVNHGASLLLDSGDCSICFSSRLNDKLPEVVCKNKSCENCYHVECLYEWLMSVNARRFFSEVVGLCPNCEKNISCPIPK